jgi:hypothetical protein
MLLRTAAHYCTLLRMTAPYYARLRIAARITYHLITIRLLPIYSRVAIICNLSLI